jgi:hypothetical protein
MADKDGMCEECHKNPALSDARFGGRCYECAGRPNQVVKAPEKKEK